MGRDTGIADRLRQAGLSVVEVDGWKTRGSAAFTPQGGVDHHTAGSNNGNAPSLGVCIRGRSDLSGPLCNVLQGFDGTCYVVAAGRANHAGAGGWKGLSGNSMVYGFERENDGHSPQRPGQYELAIRAWTAILGDIDSSMLCGHLEWAPKRKVDFHGIDYNDMRERVGSPPSPTPTNPEGDVQMFCLVQPPDPDGKIFRFTGSGMVHVPSTAVLGGDQIILKSLGLNNSVLRVSREWFDSWPILK